MSRASLLRWAVIAGRVFLGGVFLYAAYTKLREPFLLFAMSINAYKLVPEGAAEILARVLPWAEVALGLALVAGIFQRLSMLAATSLLGVFFTIMAHAYKPGEEGQQISCGCFGIGEAISPRTLLRDGALLALSLALTIAAFVAARRKRLALAGAGAASPGEEKRAQAPALQTK
jgi:uncharacterized membrane protein YphA (DoxX/SURF4 family)